MKVDVCSVDCPVPRGLQEACYARVVPVSDRRDSDGVSASLERSPVQGKAW